MPDWLKSQFTQTSGQFQREDGSTGENWLSPGHIVKDAQGRKVVLLGDDRQLKGTNDLAMNEDYNPEVDAYFDPDLGWVASGDKVNDSPWQRTHSRNRAIAGAILGTMAAGGLASQFGGMGGLGGGPETLGGSGGIDSFAASDLFGASGIPEGAGAMPWEVEIPPDLPSLPETTIPDLPAPPSIDGGSDWLNPRNVLRGANTIRQLLGGGGSQPGQGGGIAGLMGGFGAAPRIGEHRQDNDPYGLKASGWTGGLVEDDPRKKIEEAMLRKKAQENPWSFNE